MGKTQTAVEYAHRHYYVGDYDGVVWALADTLTTLQTDYGKIAERFALRGADPGNPDAVRRAVLSWLETTPGYLLILDNADDPAILKDYLPLRASGHILVTSRSQHLSDVEIANSIRLEDMLPADALAFLKERTRRKMLTPAEEQAARDLTHELGYLPLALEQAGAYIAENKMSFADYLYEYRKLDIELLEEQQPQFGGYRLSVARTWQKSFDALRAKSPAAAELLTACAFFAPEAIPYELITLGADELGGELAVALADEKRQTKKLNSLFRQLEAYSLITRDGESKTFDVHRMVQSVIRASLGENLGDRASAACDCVLGASPRTEHKHWLQWSRLARHAVAIVSFAHETNSEGEVTGRLAARTAFYLTGRARYAQAEPLSRRALDIIERVLGQDHPDTATSLNNLAYILKQKGDLSESELLYRRAMDVRERVLGSDHPETAAVLDNLASLLRLRGEMSDVEPLYRRALSIRERALGPDHRETAISLNNLADLLGAQGKEDEAEPLLRRAVQIFERLVGSDHPLTAGAVDNLASLLLTLGRLSEAEPLFRRAIDIRERVLGLDHPDTAISLNNLAYLLAVQGNPTEAELIERRALDIMLRLLGADHPNTANCLHTLAFLLQLQGKTEEAAPLIQRSVEIQRAHAERNRLPIPD